MDRQSMAYTWAMLHITIVLVLASSPVHSIQSLVNTTSGLIQGRNVVFNGKTIYEFKTVPYAEPPMGELRFKPPLPKSRVNYTIDSTKGDLILCPQTGVFATELEQKVTQLVNQNYTISEDCLYLDIYVPVSATQDKLLPVMFWIHGGGYTAGAGGYASGLVLASQSDIILVAINYRLGALGFLSTGDNNAVGDFGLRDQLMALKWVKENIESFGGDPAQITIAGESAGASSVAQLIVAPQTEGLFNRAIIQSAGMDNPWACLPDVVFTSRTFATTMNCTTTNNEEMVKCLRTKSKEEIVRFQGTWAPACTGGLVPVTLQELQTAQSQSDMAKRLAKLDLLMGINGQEGHIVHAAFLVLTNSTDKNGRISNSYYDYMFNTGLAMVGLTPNQTEAVLPAVQFQYTPWMAPHEQDARVEKIIDYAGDTFFIISALKYVHLHSKIQVEDNEQGEAYFYLLNHRPSWMKQTAKHADHGDDLFFVFGNPQQYSSLNATDKEKDLSQTIMTYWSNFIKTGNPNTPVTTVGTKQLVSWPQFELQNQTYLQLDIDMTSESVRNRLFATRMAFWTKYIPTELQRLQPSPPPQCKTSPPPQCKTSGTHMIYGTLTTVVLTVFTVWRVIIGH